MLVDKLGLAGALSLGYKDFKLRYENDGFPFGYGNIGDNNDRYRTAAAHLSYKEYGIGFNPAGPQRL